MVRTPWGGPAGCGRGSNLQQRALERWWPQATEMATALMFQAASAWRVCETEGELLRFHRLHQVPWIKSRLQVSPLTCSCVHVWKESVKCGFIGPYKVRGRREAHIQWDWEAHIQWDWGTHIQWIWHLACLNQPYMSNSVSCVTVPGFPLLPVEQGVAELCRCLGICQSESGVCTQVFLLLLLPSGCSASCLPCYFSSKQQ